LFNSISFLDLSLAMKLNKCGINGINIPHINEKK